MKQVVENLKDLTKSLTSLKFYLLKKDEPFKKTLIYYFLSHLYIGLCLGLLLTLLSLSLTNSIKNTLKNNIKNQFPQNSSIKVENNKLSLSGTSEITISLPKRDPNQPTNFLVINPLHTQNEYKTANTFILLTSDQVIFGNGTQIESSNNYENLNGTLINQENFNATIDRLTNLSSFLPLAIFLTTILLFLTAIPALRLILLYPIIIVAYFISKLFKINLTLNQTITIGLFAHAIPLLIQILFLSFNLYPNIPYFASILYLLLLLTIVTQHKQAPL